MAGTTRVDGLIDQIASLFRAIESLRARNAASVELSATEYRALWRAASVGELTPKALAASMGMSTAAITAIIDRLSARDLLERVPNPADRRSVMLRPTVAGRAVIDGSLGAFAALVTDAVADVPDGSIDEVGAVMSRIARAVQGA